MKGGRALIGLITFAYGAPTSIDDLQAYYTHINNGRKQDPQKIEAMKSQYHHLAVGDTLGSITTRQIKALQHALQPFFKEKLKAYSGFKHTPPFVSDVVQQMIEDGVTKIITVPIHPLYTKSGYIYYQVLVNSALKKLKANIPVVHIEKWHRHPKLIEVLSNRVKAAYDFMPAKTRKKTKVIFTSHSVAGNNETHVKFGEHFTALAASITEKLAITDWQIAYRSAGDHGDVWSGPDILDVIREEAANGCAGIVICELLSVTSNIEAQFDIGYDVQALCKQLNVAFFRTSFLDDSYDFIMALTEIVKEQYIASLHPYVLNDK